MTRRELLVAIGKALFYAVVSASVIFGAAAVCSRAAVEERRQTAENVAVLVRESRLNRELLCLAILEGENIGAQANRRVGEICAVVGVWREAP